MERDPHFLWTSMSLRAREWELAWHMPIDGYLSQSVDDESHTRAQLDTSQHGSGAHPLKFAPAGSGAAVEADGEGVSLVDLGEGVLPVKAA